jgi:hypothetical protein
MPSVIGIETTPLDLLVVVVAERAADLAAEGRFRPLGDDVDGAADRVAAIERALRPAQDLDPVDEQGSLRGLAVRSGVEAVRIDRDAGVGAQHIGQAADAAQAHPVGAGVERQAGRKGGEVLDRADAHDVPRRVGEGRNRDRNFLKAFLALLRGDHQFFDDIGAGRLRMGGGSGDAGQDRAGHQQLDSTLHYSLASPGGLYPAVLLNFFELVVRGRTRQ